ncbi:MAG TPA: response regulator [Polyangiaceae bacterium]
MPSAPAGPSGTRVRPGRILVIDDEPLLGEALRRALSREHQVVVVSEAAEALSWFERGERFDVVLCDLMMPGMDGIDFHWGLSTTLPREAERIVFITGGAFTARVEAFFGRVSNLLLEKPVDIEGIRALIDRRVRATSPPRGEASLSR